MASAIFTRPLTPEQQKKRETVSENQIRKAQDALFVYLMNRVEELEKKVEGNESK